MQKKKRDIEKSIDNAMGINQLFNPSLVENRSIKISEPAEIVKSFNLKLPKHMHTHVKKLAIDKEKSINELLIEAISSHYNI